MKKTADGDSVYTFSSYDPFIIDKLAVKMKNLPLFSHLLMAPFLQERTILNNAQ